MDVLPEIVAISSAINGMALKWYGETKRGGHAWPYLETPPFQQRQRVVAEMIQVLKPKRILDIGPCALSGTLTLSALGLPLSRVVFRKEICELSR
jgi:hypothetical protein